MTDHGALIWQTLEFRTPAMLEAIVGLTEAQFRWQPPNGANSIAWLLWHIAEVEDNWVRDKLYGQFRRFPFGGSVRQARQESFPGKSALLGYFHEVRARSRMRLGECSVADFELEVVDEHFGRLAARDVWIGVATSCAWHGGQIVMLANRFVPG